MTQVFGLGEQIFRGDRCCNCDRITDDSGYLLSSLQEYVLVDWYGTHL